MDRTVIALGLAGLALVLVKADVVYWAGYVAVLGWVLADRRNATA